MARDELNEITQDRWDEDIWGSVEPSTSPRPKLVFYFGGSDHWVADHIRDELIKRRGIGEDGKDTWKAHMYIDEDGIPHSFCIRESLSHRK